MHHNMITFSFPRLMASIHRIQQLLRHNTQQLWFKFTACKEDLHEVMTAEDDMRNKQFKRKISWGWRYC